MPLTEWLAGRLSSAGIKLFKASTDPKTIVKNSLGRYREERYAYTNVEKETLPLIEELAQSKLDAWSGYSRVFRCYKMIKNKPRRINYLSHRDIYMGLADIERLEEVSALVRQLKINKLNKMGTGVLTAVALHGGAVTLQEEEEKQLESDSGKKKSILENLAETPIDSTLLGEMDEKATLRAIMCMPRLMRDQDLTKEEKMENLTKDEAFRIKTILDTRSLTLADARGKIERLNNMLEVVLERFSLLRKLAIQQMEILEKTVKQKTDYKEFDKTEVNAFAYALVVGVCIRKLARLDLVITNGNITILNSAAVHEMFEETQDLLPQEDAYAIPDAQIGYTKKDETKRTTEAIRKNLDKLRLEMPNNSSEKA